MKPISGKTHAGSAHAGKAHIGGQRVLDAPRHALLAALQQHHMSMKEASRALGRNDAYLQQYIYRGSPLRLSETCRYQLADLLQIDQTSLLPPDDPARRIAGIAGGDGGDGAMMRAVPFYAVSASAGGGRVVDNADETMAFGFPRALLSRIAPHNSAALRMISISGDSMSPVLEHGDLVMIDSSQILPSPPGIFVLDDGVGLVAKRLDPVPNNASVRIISENPHYTNYQRRNDEVHIIGRVVWFARSL